MIVRAYRPAAAASKPEPSKPEPTRPEPLPLLLSHGWPGSVFEFLEILPRLTDPARFGGDPADSFTVVAPSLPGYQLAGWNRPAREVGGDRVEVQRSPHRLVLVNPRTRRALGCAPTDRIAADRERMLRRAGVLYQGSALWTSMTLAENVALPLQQFTDLPADRIREVVELKLALVGLMQTLSLEGAKHDIRVNCLAPTAATRMTEDLMPAEVLRALQPEAVVPAMLVLVGEDAPTRTILCAGAGSVEAAHITLTQGAWIGIGDGAPERLAESLSQVLDRSQDMVPGGGMEQSQFEIERAKHRLG